MTVPTTPPSSPIIPQVPGRGLVEDWDLNHPSNQFLKRHHGQQSVVHEPVLDRTMKRFIIHPIEHPELWSLYQDALGSFWVPGEIQLGRDIIEWKTKLSAEEKDLISYVLAFFATSDGIVSENLAARFIDEVTATEARFFYGFQLMIENVHAEVYANMILAFIELPEEREKMFNAMSTIECISEKAIWALKWIDDTSTPFSLRLAAFATVEGIFFSSSFAIIYWFKSRGLMPGLSHANELISRDEGLHQQFACKLFNCLMGKPEATLVTAMITDAVNIEKKFIRDAMPINLLGMNQWLMGEYIEFVADRLISMLGYPKIYQTDNPFAFMELISLEGRANFFERQVSAYQIANVKASGKRTHTNRRRK